MPGGQALWVEAQPRQRRWPRRRDEQVGLAKQLVQNAQALLGFEIRGHELLMGMQLREPIRLEHLHRVAGGRQHCCDVGSSAVSRAAAAGRAG